MFKRLGSPLNKDKEPRIPGPDTFASNRISRYPVAFGDPSTGCSTFVASIYRQK